MVPEMGLWPLRLAAVSAPDVSLSAAASVMHPDREVCSLHRRQFCLHPGLRLMQLPSSD